MHYVLWKEQRDGFVANGSIPGAVSEVLSMALGKTAYQAWLRRKNDYTDGRGEYKTNWKYGSYWCTTHRLVVAYVELVKRCVMGIQKAYQQYISHPSSNIYIQWQAVCSLEWHTLTFYPHYIVWLPTSIWNWQLSVLGVHWLWWIMQQGGDTATGHAPAKCGQMKMVCMAYRVCPLQDQSSVQIIEELPMFTNDIGRTWFLIC